MELRNKLSIWQQNINKLPVGQHSLISSGKLTDDKIDIIALKEPAINTFNQSMATKDWVTIYVTPADHGPDSPIVNTTKRMKVMMRKQSIRLYVFQEWSDKSNQGQ
jgi:hypothetical protein